MKKQFGSRITINSGNLRNTAESDWMKAIMTALNAIYAKQSGQCVLAQLHRTSKHIVITPHYEWEGDGETGPANWNQGYYQFRPVRNGAGNYISGTGTGTGTDAVIRLATWHFPESERATALLHEMVHAAEYMAGVMYCNPIKWGMLTTTEFDAIVVQNIFAAESHQPQIRNHSSWNPWNPLTGKMVPQDDAYKRLLASFKARMPAMVDQLSRIKTSFNPYHKGSLGWIQL